MLRSEESRELRCAVICLRSTKTGIYLHMCIHIEVGYLFMCQTALRCGLRNADCKLKCAKLWFKIGLCVLREVNLSEPLIVSSYVK